MEKTLVILKPDAIKRKLVGKIISRFEEKDYTISRMEKMQLKRSQVEEHYSHIRNLPIFEDIIEYMVCSEVIVIVLEGKNVISTVRQMIGSTSNYKSLPGTIRGDYGNHEYMNIIHASDSTKSAEEEIKRFFLIKKVEMESVMYGL